MASQASPTHIALRIFGIAVTIGLVIIAVLYIIYAGCQRVEARQPRNLRGGPRRIRDPEAAAGTASRNAQSVHSVDTLPRYEVGANAPSAPPERVSGSEHGQVEGEEAKPPPYTLDAADPVVTGAEHDDGHGDERAENPVTPAPAHLQNS